jgi:hypothetical protein
MYAINAQQEPLAQSTRALIVQSVNSLQMLVLISAVHVPVTELPPVRVKANVPSVQLACILSVPVNAKHALLAQQQLAMQAALRVHLEPLLT